MKNPAAARQFFQDLADDINHLRMKAATLAMMRPSHWRDNELECVRADLAVALDVAASFRAA